MVSCGRLVPNYHICEIPGGPASQQIRLQQQQAQRCNSSNSRNATTPGCNPHSVHCPDLRTDQLGKDSLLFLWLRYER